MLIEMVSISKKRWEELINNEKEFKSLITQADDLSNGLIRIIEPLVKKVIDQLIKEEYLIDKDTIQDLVQETVDDALSEVTLSR